MIVTQLYLNPVCLFFRSITNVFNKHCHPSSFYCDLCTCCIRKVSPRCFACMISNSEGDQYSLSEITCCYGLQSAESFVGIHPIQPLI